jgi:hypothetical protein
VRIAIRSFGGSKIPTTGRRYEAGASASTISPWTGIDVPLGGSTARQCEPPPNAAARQTANQYAAVDEDRVIRCPTRKCGEGIVSTARANRYHRRFANDP